MGEVRCLRYMSISLPWAYGPHAWYVAGIIIIIRSLFISNNANYNQQLKMKKQAKETTGELTTHQK